MTHSSLAASKQRHRVLMVVNSPGFFLSHRRPIALGALQAGYDVHVATPAGPDVEVIRGLGITHHIVPVERSGLVPWREAQTLFRLVRLYRVLRPALVHHVALKAVLYGTLASRIARVPAVVNAVAGLGYLFTGTSLRARVLRTGFILGSRVALKRPGARFIFQNPDDQELMIKAGLALPSACTLIRGSGVDTRAFAQAPEPPGVPLVVLPSRMLWAKGVGEFVEAARILRDRGVSARLALVGGVDPGNPDTVPPERLAQWKAEGLVECWGHRADMPVVLAQAAVVALPSYREGVPKVLLEAASCGRPIVTTDVPGCREVVRHGENGLLVPARDARGLADAIQVLVSDTEARRRLGARGRARALAEYGVERVVASTLDLYGALLQRAGVPS